MPNGAKAEMMEDFSLTLKAEIRATSSSVLISRISGNAWDSLPHVHLLTQSRRDAQVPEREAVWAQEHWGWGGGWGLCLSPALRSMWLSVNTLFLAFSLFHF